RRLGYAERRGRRTARRAAARLPLLRAAQPVHDHVRALRGARRVRRLGDPLPHRRSGKLVRLAPGTHALPLSDQAPRQTARGGASGVRFRIVDPVSSVVLLSGTTRYPDHDQALAEMRRAARLGQSAANYRILQAVDGRYYFNVVDVDDDIVATRKQRFATEAE